VKMIELLILAVGFLLSALIVIEGEQKEALRQERLHRSAYLSLEAWRMEAGGRVTLIGANRRPYWPSIPQFTDPVDEEFSRPYHIPCWS